MKVKSLLVLFALLAVSACTATQKAGQTQRAAPVVDAASGPGGAATGNGGYLAGDGPGADAPANINAIPDAVPKAEPLHRYANRPYSALGKTYTPLQAPGNYKERGIASWYGKKFHGQRTSIGETYDMYGMTAAHPTLPIPSYARVTNLANGKSVVVRVNDRGPFHSDRIIDLSYTAAWKLGYADAGSARVEVESLVPGAPPAPLATAQSVPIAPANARPAADAKGYVLQLGAFSAADTAENFRARVYRELAWLSETIAVVPGGNLFRLHLGPYRSQDEARSIADR